MPSFQVTTSGSLRLAQWMDEAQPAHSPAFHGGSQWEVGVSSTHSLRRRVREQIAKLSPREGVVMSLAAREGPW